MPKPISIEEYLHILKQAIDPDNPLIDSIQLFMDANNDLIAQVHDEKDPGAVEQFQIIDFDGYVTIPVGNQAIDLLAGHFFKSTPDQNATWTTTSARQGWLVWFHVDNTATKTITFGSGFTDVDSITETGIQNKLLYYDGATWREIALGGSVGLPTGIDNQTLVMDTTWKASDNLLNDNNWQVWNQGTIHGGKSIVTDNPVAIDADLIEIELSTDIIVDVQDIGNKEGHYVVFKFTEDSTGDHVVNFSDDFIHNGARSYNANETFTIAFIYDGSKWNEVPSFKVENAQYDKIVFYDTARLILYGLNGQEMKRIQTNSGEYIEFFPKYSVYDNVNSVFYTITDNSKLIKHDTTTVLWVVSDFNILDGSDQNVISGIKLGSDGYLYVTTRVRVYVFDSDGNAVTNFGGFGYNTNGKFVSIIDFQEYDGYLYILDWGHYVYGSPITSQLQKVQNDGTFQWRINDINYSEIPFYGYCLALDANYIYLLTVEDDRVCNCLVLNQDGTGVYPSIDFYLIDSGEDNLLPKKCLINENGDLIVTHGYVYIDGTGIVTSVSELSIWGINGTFIAKQSLTSLTGGNRNYNNIYMDSANNYWLNDMVNNKLESYWLDDTFLTSSSNYSQFTYSTGVTLDYDLSTINGVACVSNKIFVADFYNNSVYIFDSSLNYLTKFTVTSIDAICEDRVNGYIVCSCDDHVEVRDTTGNLVLSFDGGVGDGDMLDNWYIACSPVTAKFYLTQYGSDYVYVYDTDGTYLSRFGGTGTDNGKFNTPYGLDIDDEDNIYVVDGTGAGHGRVQKLNNAGTYLLTFVGLDLEYAKDIVCGQNGINYVIGSGSGADGFVPYFDKGGTYLGLYGHGVTGSGYGYFYAPTYGAYLDPYSEESVALPVGTENQTLRYNANNELEATDSVLIYDGDGAKTSDDHTVGLNERFPNLIYCDIGNKPTASGYPIGTVCVEKVGGVSVWASVADGLNNDDSIWAILTATDGYIYGVSGDGRLYQFNGTNAWVQKATVYGSYSGLRFIVELAGSLYTAVQNTSIILKFNGTNAWIPVTTQITTEHSGTHDVVIESMAVHNGKIYVGTSFGEIYEWNGVDTLVVKSQQLTWGERISCLAHYSYTDKLYASVYGDQASPNRGKLFEWNGIDTIVEVADRIEDEVGNPYYGMSAIMEFDNYMFGVTASAKLVRWNDADAWELFAPRISTYYAQPLRSGIMLEHLSKLYIGAGNATCGRLLEFNDADNSWTELITPPNNNIPNGPCSLASLGDYIYGAGGDIGKLYRADIYEIGESNIYINIGDAWVRCVDNLDLATISTGLALWTGSTNITILGAITTANIDCGAW